MIAIIVPYFTGYFFLELIKGIQEELSKYQYDIILYNIDNTDKTELFLKRTLEEKRVDGVILCSLKISDHYVQLFKKSKISIILVDSYHPHLDSIVIENEDGAYMATKYLIDLGHKKIGMIDAQLKSPPAKQRLEGYKKALIDHQIPFHEEYFVISEVISDADGFSRESGYEAMNRLLSKGKNRPTAMFISSDIQAVGAIKAIREKGLRIPEDISIVGFDDIELAEYLGLTTVRQPIFEMGKMSVERLIKKVSESDTQIVRKSFSTELVVRESCGTCK
jgi:DNA-binding LacI/PurR family transcriptional regulator